MNNREPGPYPLLAPIQWYPDPDEEWAEFLAEIRLGE